VEGLAEDIDIDLLNPRIPYTSTFKLGLLAETDGEFILDLPKEFIFLRKLFSFNSPRKSSLYDAVRVLDVVFVSFNSSSVDSYVTFLRLDLISESMKCFVLDYSSLFFLDYELFLDIDPLEFEFEFTFAV